LWEVHVLTGIRGVTDLPDRATVVALRAHHSVTDGLGLVQMARALFGDADITPSTGRPPSLDLGVVGAIVKLPVALAELAVASVGSARARRSLDALVREGKITEPELHRPRTRFNIESTGPRQFGRVRFALSDVRAVARTTDTTVNQVVMALVSAAMATYLANRDETPVVSLAAQVPVSIADRSDLVSENRTTVAFVDLHTDTTDPLDRLRLIRESAEREKARLDRPETEYLASAVLDRCPAPVLRKVIRRDVGASIEAHGGGTVPSHTIVSNCARGSAVPLRFGDSPAVDGFSAPVLNRTSGLLHMTTSLGEVLNVTFSSKQVSMPDPVEYEQLLIRAFDELRSAAELAREGDTDADPSMV
ncbi:MAG: DUF1298 domain-containing protein, partial [Rhodococcus sp.]|nr:DUF1298 domain-containing protein [Rhodococcus sp. (in: high G+C Gram-positive bacteria)]